jgi:hypothetical protein
MLLHIALEANQRGHGTFILVEPGIHSAARIIDVGHQHTLRPTPLEPVMVRAVQLHHLAHVNFPCPPRSVWTLPSSEMRDPICPQPPPQGLSTEYDSMPLSQLLCRQRGIKVSVPLRIQGPYLGRHLFQNPPMRWLSTAPMHEARVPFGPNPTMLPSLSGQPVYTRGHFYFGPSGHSHVGITLGSVLEVFLLFLLDFHRLVTQSIKGHPAKQRRRLERSDLT